MVERNGRNVMMKHVGFDDAVEESAANESEFAVNGCGGSTNVVPAFGGIVGERRVGVLQVGDCH